MKHTPSHNQPSEIQDLGLSEDLIHSLRNMVESERSASMMSMPAERVMRALRAAGVRPGRVEEFLERELLSWFRPVFVAALLLIAVLAAYNVELSLQNDYDQTATEMVLGLQPVTVAAAYDIDFDHH
ncbi:MAG: hypothetical protein O3C45_05140 [Bacteroidetes bacterium]|nr:hypothetical protein [Bacteroidota bacterium]MDA0874432.1 hypothetical protein [Bacteroidota bacterium]